MYICPKDHKYQIFLLLYIIHMLLQSNGNNSHTKGRGWRDYDLLSLSIKKDKEKETIKTSVNRYSGSLKAEAI